MKTLGLYLILFVAAAEGLAHVSLATLALGIALVFAAVTFLHVVANPRHYNGA